LNDSHTWDRDTPSSEVRRFGNSNAVLKKQRNSRAREAHKNQLQVDQVTDRAMLFVSDKPKNISRELR
jgi:hypothetical protein